MEECKMMLRRYMSLLGIGSAKVDLIIDKLKYKLNEEVTGYFQLYGGTIEQQIKRIECDLVRTNRKLENEIIIESITIHIPQQIEPWDKNKLPFSFQLPSDIQNTNNEVMYHFKTKLIFNEGVKSLDHDYIFIAK